MVNISKKTSRKNGVEVIVSNDKKLLNEKHVEEQLKHSSLAAITNQYSSKIKNKIQELQNCGNYQPCRRFLKENFAVKVTMDCRTTAAVDFKTRLGFG